MDFRATVDGTVCVEQFMWMSGLEFRAVVGVRFDEDGV